MATNQNNQMNPSDSRNLIIFMVISALLYFAYDTYIMRPHQEAMRQARIEAAKLQQSNQSSDAALSALSDTAKSNAPKDIPSLLQKTTNITIQNDKIAGSLSTTGGSLNYIQLNDYFETLEQNNKITLLAPKGSQHARTVEYGWVSADSSLKLPSNKTRWSVAGEQTILAPGKPVVLYWNNGQGVRFDRIFTLDENYVITVDQKVTNNADHNISLHPYGLVSQRGISPHFEGRSISHEGPIAYIGDKLHKQKYKDLRKKRQISENAATGWIGITDKYWLTALMPPQGQNIKYRFNYSGTPPKKKETDTGLYQTDFTGSALTLAPGQSGSVQSHVFTGPKRVLMLKDYSKTLGVDKLDLAIDFGMFWFLTIPFFYALHYLGLLIGNMGLAIIALTIIIRTMASPLTYKSYSSFAKMKKVMPKVKELQEKYGDDEKQKLQQDMIALYQREGVNPMAGCFPILLQIPIFFAFYKILFITLEVRHQPFYGWIKDLSAPDPTNLFTLFGLIDWDPPSLLHVGIWPCLMLVAMQIQRMLSPPPVDKIQRDMMRLFPIIMTFVMAKFASGLVIYWTVSAFFGNIQQIVIMRKMGVPIHLFGESHDDEDDKNAAPASAAKSDAADIEDADYEVIENIKPPKPKKKKKK